MLVEVILNTELTLCLPLLTIAIVLLACSIVPTLMGVVPEIIATVPSVATAIVACSHKAKINVMQSTSV